MLMPAKYFMKPGYILVPDRPTAIATVLGSCVSVCIYDGLLQAGGMNHFQLPSSQQAGRSTARYGDAATLKLIRLMVENGSKVRNMEAQIFGGAYNAEISSWNVGFENIHIAKKILGVKGIPVVSEDVGGNKGRKIIFNTRTNEIAVLKMDEIRKDDWFPYEGDRR